MNLIGISKLDSYFVYGGISQALFYLALGYFIATINCQTIKLPIIGFICSVLLLYFISFSDLKLSAVPLAMMTFYLMVICVNHPDIGVNTFLPKFGTYTLAIYILHLFVSDVIIRILVYSGYTKYFESWIYYPLAIILSVLIPVLLANTYKRLMIKVSS